MKTGKIKIGQIGMAPLTHAGATLDCIRKYPDVFEIVGIADDHAENLRLCGAGKDYFGIPVMSTGELLNVPGLRAVTVETEELKLLEYAAKAVNCGLHVHIEKPAGADLASFKNILRTAMSKQLTVQMAYMYRYNPAVQYCMDLVNSGSLGKIFATDAFMNTRHTVDIRKYTSQFPGGNMFYLGCHMVDLTILTRGMPDRIIPMNKKTGFDGLNGYDNGFAIFEYENGISAIRAASNEVNGYGRRQFVVCGEKGTVEIRPLEGDSNGPPSATVSINPMTAGKDYTDCKKPVSLMPAEGRYDTMMLDFADMVLGKKQNPFSYEYEYNVQKSLLAACGLPIDLKECL